MCLQAWLETVRAKRWVPEVIAELAVTVTWHNELMAAGRTEPLATENFSVSVGPFCSQSPLGLLDLHSTHSIIRVCHSSCVLWYNETVIGLYITFKVVMWLRPNIVTILINILTPCQVGLVLAWVTFSTNCIHVNTILLFNQLSRSTQPGHPSVGRW